jgi:alanyl-tRNA synthetase
MIHRAFREMLGDTATQMGSENAPGRLRFDFPSPAPVPQSVLADAEALVNDVLQEDLQVSAAQMSQSEAVAMGAMALFGEKYGEVVRVVSVGDWAHELCGGTHAATSGQLGVVKFLSESSIGAGVRRVEALVGSDAYQFLAREHHLVNQLSQMVKVRPDELPERVDAIMRRLKEAEKEIERVRKEQMLAKVDDIMGSGTDVGRFRLWAMQAPDGLNGGELRQLAARARSMVAPERPVGIIGGSVSGDKVSVVATVNAKAVQEGLSASDMLAAAMPAVGGRGGGKADMAQGGGNNPAGLAAAFEAARGYVARVAGE